MKELLKKILFGETVDDRLVEGIYAHNYTNEEVRQQIKSQYIKKHTVKETPLTHPLKFDPLNPPKGWIYDPYYEYWVETK